MIAMLGGLSDVERGLMHTRTARAEGRGPHMGRPPSLTAPHQREVGWRGDREATRRLERYPIELNRGGFPNRFRCV